MTTRSLSVEIHSVDSIEDCSSLPLEISRIYRTLTAPLPSWCAKGPYPFLSAGSLPLLSELSQLPITVYSDSDHTPHPLGDVLNLALSTVSDIRSLIGHYGSSRSAVPFVSSLMRVLAHVCAKDAIILTGAAFLRPRTTTPQRRGFDGIATMLACHPVHSFEKGSKSLTSGSLPDTIGDSPDASLPAVYPMQMDSESDCFPSGASSLDVPLDAHVPPGRGRHPGAVLPFFCVADIDNIVDLMSTVACQRHVWGIAQPVIGFALSESGVVAKFVLSWLDPATGTVHITCPAGDTALKQPAPFGIFDFTNVAAALSFAQLVLSLSDDFATISEHAIAGCENNRLDWRSDKVPSEDGESWKDRVTRWVYDVEISCGKSSSLPPTPPASPPEGVSPHPSEPSEKSMASSVRKGTPGSHPPEGDRPTAKSHNSSSTFAGVSAKGFDPSDTERADILTWIFDRRVQLCGLIPMAGTVDSEEINEKIAAYNDISQFLWPPSWTTNSPPPVDAALSDVRSVLLNQAVDIQKVAYSSGEQRAAHSPSKRAVLKPAHERFLEEHMSTLLSASVGAFTLHTKRFGIKVNEAESRHDWDALLYRFYTVNGEDASPYVLLEKTIHFARNQAADRMDTMDAASFIEDQEKQAKEYRDSCFTAQLQATALSLSYPVITQAITASTHANALVGNVAKFLGHQDRSKRRMQKRSGKEPRDGICDAVLFAAIPDEWELIEDAEFIRNAHAEALPAIPSLARRETQLQQFTHQLQNPFYACTTDISPDFPAPNPDTIRSFKNCLLLPHAVAEYKKSSHTEGKALNQGRMYLVSLVAFYSAFGIEDYPFYCLVTSGKLGAILMAWKSSKRERTYLIERNVRKFDVSSPIQAYHFATFLLRLRDDQEQLKRRVEARLKDGGVDRNRLREWRKSAQVAETEAMAEIDRGSDTEAVERAEGSAT
ncbi:hypothetical protein B0H17DRAFT_159612 [Mycena rosella]|uniref:Uncharacterized protein n=1 Tax=Mycena rosella TaxID=1033263 RepID=A0AAD7AWS1_MYCRO|nr:hypothetical protein B0H17DRAFT_159612 [Mycena rosella]